MLWLEVQGCYLVCSNYLLKLHRFLNAVKNVLLLLGNCVVFLGCLTCLLKTKFHVLDFC